MKKSILYEKKGNLNRKSSTFNIQQSHLLKAQKLLPVNMFPVGDFFLLAICKNIHAVAAAVAAAADLPQQSTVEYMSSFFCCISIHFSFTYNY